MTKFYAVTGRIVGDDEDTLLLVQAENNEQATEAFKAELRAIRNVAAEDYDSPDYEIYIGAMVWSKTPIYE